MSTPEGSRNVERADGAVPVKAENVLRAYDRELDRLRVIETAARAWITVIDQTFIADREDIDPKHEDALREALERTDMETCNRWMSKAQTLCDRPRGHADHCRTREGMIRKNGQHRHYVRSEKGRAARLVIAARDRAKHRDENRARSAVAHAVKTGALVRLACFCGETEVEGHHHLGYDRDHWLDVEWLCDPHHKEAHRG